MRLGKYSHQAWFVESARWSVKHGGLDGLGGFEVRPPLMGRDYGRFVLIMYCFLVAGAGNVFLSYLDHALGAECVLGCGVEVARGAGVLRWPRRAACLGALWAAIVVSSA